MWPFNKKMKAKTIAQVPRDWDNLPSLVMTPVYEPFSYQELVRYLCTQAPNKQLVSVVPYGWGTSQGKALRGTHLIYEFADDPKLVLMRIDGPSPADVELIIRATFMREAALEVEATTFHDLFSRLSDLAKRRGLKSKITK